MTFEERMNIIEQKAIRDKKEKEKEQNDLQVKTEQTLQKIRELSQRIKDLITLANKCIELNIEFPYYTYEYDYGYKSGGDSYNFIADGIFHHVGFIGHAKNTMFSYGMFKKILLKVEYIGIINGGANGIYDFYTDGTMTFSKCENHEPEDPKLEDMEKFLNEFESFESAFYKWIDEMM